MDIDHLIETRKYIFFSEILEANKNIKNIKKIEPLVINYDYRGIRVCDYDSKVEVSSILDEIENRSSSRFLCYKFIVFLIESSHLCTQMLKQKSYDRISSHLYPYLLDVFNTIVTEKDTGIITKSLNSY